MSEWRGLTDPEQHRPVWDGDTAWCDCGSFGVECTVDRPCRCCLAAEVKRLTALLKAADDVVASQDRRIAAALALLQPDAGGWCDCLAHRIGRALRGES